MSCYRIYDADLPEFSFALDVYQSEITPDLHWYHLQEYQAPKTIDPDKAELRIELAKQAVRQVFKLDDHQLFCKTRVRQRGKQQYQKQDNQGEMFQVREGRASSRPIDLPELHEAVGLGVWERPEQYAVYDAE